MAITEFFVNPSVWGIGLAIVFGAVWLASLRPLNLRSPWLWVVLVAGAILFSPGILWIQAPLQKLISGWLIGRFGIDVYQTQLLLMGTPVVLLSGLVQEGAKLIPVVVYWWRKGRNIDPKLGLSVGAMAGAGFGIFEVQWLLNSIFASGWNWETAQAFGFLGFAGLWERFFAVAFHIAVTALAGWGLAKGWGWQFFLLVSFLHFALNYSAIVVQLKMLTVFQVEIIIAIFASILFGIVLWLRWRKLHYVWATP